MHPSGALEYKDQSSNGTYFVPSHNDGATETLHGSCAVLRSLDELAFGNSAVRVVSIAHGSVSRASRSEDAAAEDGPAAPPRLARQPTDGGGSLELWNHPLTQLLLASHAQRAVHPLGSGMRPGQNYEEVVGEWGRRMFRDAM